METILQVKQIEKIYGNKGSITRAIEDISFEVKKGEFVGIMGPSGSGLAGPNGAGKTTLLNCISTIDTVTSGHILIGKDDITKMKSSQLSKFRREQLGFIFQDFNLLDTLTAYENIALPLTIQRVNPKKIEARIKKLSVQLGIEEVLKKYPYQMSGGQQQRVACARAMICHPSLILADEPTGALDSKASRMLLNSFEVLNKTLEATILMVTHDAFTASFAHRILFIKDGRIFNELVRGDDDRKTFFNRIIEVVSLLGGDTNNVL